MYKAKPNQLSTLLRHKIMLIAWGIFLSVILLEISLRLGGFIILSRQEHKNQVSLRQKGAFRIMCLGESTTAGQYPVFLEERLNQAKIGISFAVIDKGVDAITTSTILWRLSDELDEYRPEMVVAMMGINDGTEYVDYEITGISKAAHFFKSWRTYKLARLLWRHILHKVGIYKPQLGQPGFAPGVVDAQPVAQIEAFNQAIAINPNDSQAYIGLGWLYHDQGRFAQAIEAFNQAIAINPNDSQAYIGLGWLYRDQKEISQAESLFKKAIVIDPGNDAAYVDLGKFYWDQGRILREGQLCWDQSKISLSLNAFNKAIELNPKNDAAYTYLGWLYHDQGRFVQAIEAFNQAIAIDPQNEKPYLGLGRIYQKQDRLLLSLDAFKQAIAINPRNIRAYAAISVLYETLNQPKQSEVYARQANTMRLGFYNPITVNSYHKLKTILDKKGIKLVCVQYPMRSVEPLKKIFESNNSGIIFVDNERIFREAVKKAGVKTYFKDMFGYDFGHCTPAGNRLLAENIAQTILKEAFGR